MNIKLYNYIKNSFLKPLLDDPNITDISYNGEELFYQHNLYGRRKAELDIDLQKVNDFIRQVANLSEQQFSYSMPFLDVSVKTYRLNAVHGAIVRVNNDKAISFSLRITNENLLISEDDNFMPKRVSDFLLNLIKAHISIVIGGKTSTGKTELQKYLLQNIEENGRIIIIDNVQELDQIRKNKKLDITSWLVNEYIKNGDFESLIRNAVRSNPDWLIIAEARGKEMSSVLNAVMTGHPIITTIHSKDALSMPKRMARMVLLNGTNTNYKEVIEDIYEHFQIYIYLKKRIINGKIYRYIDTICETEGNKLQVLYQKQENGDYFGTVSSFIRNELKNLKVEDCI